MKLIISGKAYDLQDALKPSLQTAVRLKRGAGFGMKTLMERAQKMGALEDQSDLLDDADLCEAFAAMIWLAKVNEGEDVSFEDVLALDLTEYQFEPDKAEEPAPKAQTGSEADESKAE